MKTVNLPPQIAQAVRFRWLGGQHGMLLEPILPDDFDQADLIVRAVLPAFFSIGRWNEITRLTEFIQMRRSYGTDLRAVVFRDSAQPGAAGPVGFSIEDGTDNELLLDEKDFIALAARWLGALRDGAVRSGDPATEAEWWLDWTDKVARIERSASAP